MQIQNKIITVLSMLLILGGLLSNNTHALSPTPETNFILSPIKSAEQTIGHYVDQISPGAQRKYQFFITNISDKTINLRIFPADVQPDENGGRGFSSSNNKPTFAGSWLLPQKIQEITLKPREKKQFSYEVNVPKNLAPGQYIAVAGVEELTTASATENRNSKEAQLIADIENRRGTQMILEYKKEQAAHEMSIDDFKHDYISDGTSQITIKLSNTGTILEKPTGRIIVTDKDEKTVFSKNYKADSIYGKTTANMVYPLNGDILWPGEYRAYYEATYNGTTISRVFEFTVTEEESQRSIEDQERAGYLQINNSFMDWLKECVEFTPKNTVG